jgi:hypothetical protein
MSVKYRTTAAVLLAAITLGAGPGRYASRAAEEKAALPKPAVADVDVPDWVAKRVKAWQPTGEERRFDEIAWVKDIREAERLSKKHGRAVFLFTHDGRMNIGRC